VPAVCWWVGYSVKRSHRLAAGGSVYDNAYTNAAGRVSKPVVCRYPARQPSEDVAAAERAMKDRAVNLGVGAIAHILLARNGRRNALETEVL
jgi:hypothetical protein